MKVGQATISITRREKNLGGNYYEGVLTLIGKTKTANVAVKWLMKGGKIQGESIRISPAKGMGELLSIAATYSDKLK